MPESRAVKPAVLVPAKPTPVAEFAGMRALAWHSELLFASRGYELLCANMSAPAVEWGVVGFFRPSLWRKLSSSFSLSSRLSRDGFHALAVLDRGHLVAAVPGAIVTMAPGETEFRVSHEIRRGTRPLHFATTPSRKIFWGEYFDNPRREPVHIYASEDCGFTWSIAYTFPKGSIRHVHNIVYDEFEKCLWVLTGDEGRECQIIRASCDFKSVETVLAGSQQARAVTILPARNALYFASDTPLEQNHVYRLGRNGTVSKLSQLNSSSISGCRVGNSLFFSTMVEPSPTNTDRCVRLYRSPDGEQWEEFLHWKKDLWPMKLFQYGNAFLPDGCNATDLLAVSTVAVTGADQQTTLWRI